MSALDLQVLYAETELGLKFKFLIVCWLLGPVSIRNGMSIPMLKIRRPDGRLIFNMEIAIRR